MDFSSDLMDFTFDFMDFMLTLMEHYLVNCYGYISQSTLNKEKKN